MTKRVSWTEFAVRLFKTEDADPGYMCLARAQLPLDQKKRYMVAWCTYYNPGLAAQASEHEGKDFWRYLFSQYATAKRATERRHFRGAAGLIALRAWQRKFPDPEDMIDYMRGDTYFDVRRKGQTLEQIGTYFVWKFADVQERVFRYPCDFTGAAKHSPKVPQEGAKLINPDASVEYTYNEICAVLNGAKLRSPPWYDRRMNMQEAETVACVYHQYLGGGYVFGSRTAKAIRRLTAVPCAASSALLEAFDGSPLLPLRVSPAQKQIWADRILEGL